MLLFVFGGAFLLRYLVGNGTEFSRWIGRAVGITFWLWFVAAAFGPFFWFVETMIDTTQRAPVARSVGLAALGLAVNFAIPVGVIVVMTLF